MTDAWQRLGQWLQVDAVLSLLGRLLDWATEWETRGIDDLEAKDEDADASDGGHCDGCICDALGAADQDTGAGGS